MHVLIHVSVEIKTSLYAGGIYSSHSALLYLKSANLIGPIVVFSLTIRFHVAVRLVSNRSQWIYR